MPLLVCVSERERHLALPVVVDTCRPPFPVSCPVVPLGAAPDPPPPQGRAPRERCALTDREPPRKEAGAGKLDQENRHRVTLFTAGRLGGTNAATVSYQTTVDSVAV